MRRIVTAFLLLASVTASADENPPRLNRERREENARRHFILTAEHTLRAAEKAELAAAGVEIQHALPGHRYIVRAGAPETLAADPRVASLEPIAPSKKLARSAIREMARGRAFARVRLVFHSDVSFAAARAAVEGAGGTVDQVLGSDFVLPHRLEARIPFGTLSAFASDDRVFAVYGPPLRIVANNAVAAQISQVTPLFTAPYNLSGSGVVVSEFELGQADVSHVEFGGRLTNHVVGGTSSSQSHATHTAGTIIAAGVNPAAKGMAPNATLRMFDVRPDYPIIMNNKESQLAPLGVVADNNSWGFQLGWQQEGSGTFSYAWFGGEDYFGGYDAFYSAAYDKVGRTTPVLFVQSSGNDGNAGSPVLGEPFSPHGHSDDDGVLISGETFCYSQNGTGTDCTSPCSVGPSHCELERHPMYGPFATVGPTGSLKNVLAIGAVRADKTIAGFSSRGPTHDGRVKPDLVAKGVSQFSTLPGGGYTPNQGTSMAAPVVTGISALLTEQWRKSFGGTNPLPIALKTLLIAGAEDLGLPGPDYTFGFGLANAQASAELIIADGNSGSRIRVGNISQGQQIETEIAVTAPQKLRVVVCWADPEVLLGPDDLAEKTLVNDLDVKVVDQAGNAVFAYVLDKDRRDAAATRGVNSIDNTEEVEIANAPAGPYRVILTGTNVATGPMQQYALIANAPLGGATIACNDSFEPNDSEATAFGYLVNRTTLSASTCSATDVDYYKIRTATAGLVTVSVTATATPLRVTLSGNGITPVVRDVAAGTTASVSTTAGSVAAIYLARVEVNGTLGSDARGYTLLTEFATSLVPRRRSTQH